MNVVDRILHSGDFEREIYCAGLRTELFVQTTQEKKERVNNTLVLALLVYLSLQNVG